MFDIGFVEILLCAVIALLILGPERLPTAARAAGRWVGGAKRMVSQFNSELDRQLKADELREELRKAGDVSLEDVQKTVQDALAEAERQEHIIRPDRSVETQASASRNTANSPGKDNESGTAEPTESSSQKSPDNRS